MDYSDFVLSNCPDTAIYIPNFITSEEEQQILRSVENAPKPKWTQLAHRRLINYGGIPHKNGMIAEEIPKWLQIYVDKINNSGIFHEKKANHVLVNEYLAGQGIMPHLDGALFYPTISTISCGSHTMLEFTSIERNQNNESIVSNSTDDTETELITQNKKFLFFNNKKLLLEPRSLLILKDDMYNNYLHSIAETNYDMITDNILNINNCENFYKYGERLSRTKRISLTIRHVPKTTKIKLKLSV